MGGLAPATQVGQLCSGENVAAAQDRPSFRAPVDVHLLGSTVKEAHGLVERLAEYPDIDLFKEYP
jgi:hypothetical protein